MAIYAERSVSECTLVKKFHVQIRIAGIDAMTQKSGVDSKVDHSELMNGEKQLDCSNAESSFTKRY
jgi:hypothetical protein